MARLLALPLFLLLACTCGAQPRAQEPSALNEVEKLRVENAQLRVALAQAQAQLKSAPAVCEISRQLDAARALVTEVEKSHGAPGYHFNIESGAFVKDAAQPEQPHSKGNP